MATRAQFVGDSCGDSAFDLDIESAHHFPAWRIACCLRLLPFDQHARQGLDVALRLDVATH